MSGIHHRVIRTRKQTGGKKVLSCRLAGWSKKCGVEKNEVGAWYAGQDFFSVQTSYFSIRNQTMLKKDGYTHILIESINVEIQLL